MAESRGEEPKLRVVEGRRALFEPSVYPFHGSLERRAHSFRAAGSVASKRGGRMQAGDGQRVRVLVAPRAPRLERSSPF